MYIVVGQTTAGEVLFLEGSTQMDSWSRITAE